MRFLQRSVRPAGLAVLLCLAMLFVVQVSSAQSDLENTLKQYSANDVKGYIQPIADLFGANMQAGWFHSARIPETGFNMSFGIVAMGAVVGDDQKVYDANSPYGGTFKTATVFGGKGGSSPAPPGSGLSPYRGSDGVINTSLFPLASPQLRIGSFYGTEAIIRWLPTTKAGDLGDASFFGIGARHSLSQYLEESPVDIAAGVAYSKFSLGDFLDFNGLSIGAQASKSFSVVTLYSGLAWQQTTLNLTYAPSNPQNAAVDIDLDGANSVCFTAGAGLDLFILSIFADANFGSVTNFSGGIVFGF